MSGNEKSPQPLDLTSDKAMQELDRHADAKSQNQNESQEKKDVIDQRTSALDKLKTEAQRQISAYHLDTLPTGIDAKTQQYLYEYFQGSIDRFDKDKDGKISEAEANEFQSQMAKKTAQLVGEIMSAGKEHKEGQEAANQVKKLNTKEVESSLESITDISENLELNQGLQEFEKMQSQNQAFQQEIQTQIESINNFQQGLAKFQEKQHGMKAYNSMIVNLFNDSRKNEELELKQKQQEVIGQLKKTLANLERKKAILDKNGEILKQAIAQERQRVIKERDDKLQEIADAKEEQSSLIEQKKKKYKELNEAQESLIKRREAASQKLQNNQEFRAKWENQQRQEQLDTKKKESAESTQNAEEELKSIELILNDPSLTPEAKEQVEKSKEEVLSRLQRSKAGQKIIAEKIEKGENINRVLDDSEQQAETELKSADNYLNEQIIPSKLSLDQNINRLESLKLLYVTEASDVTKHYNQRVDDIDKISETVNDNIFSSAISRNKSINSLSSAIKSLESLNIESKSKWNIINPFFYFDAVSTDLSALAHNIDSNTNSLLKDIREKFNEEGSSKIGWGAVYGLTQVGGAFAGFVSGGAELVGGVSSMIAHPLEAVKGIGTLAGFNAEKMEFNSDTFFNSWKAMGKSITGYDQVEGDKENYGGMVGKAAFNILSMFVGAGEVGAVGKAGTASKLAKVAQIESGLAKFAKSANYIFKSKDLAGKLAEMQKVNKVAYKSLQKAARAESRAAFRQTFVSEIKPQVFTKIGEEMSISPTYMGKAGVVGKYALKGSLNTAQAIPRTALKFAKEVVATPIVGTYALVTKGIPRAISSIPKLARRLKSEGLIGTFRSSKLNRSLQTITEESGNYVKAQQRLREIIESDLALSDMAKQGKMGLRSAESAAKLKLFKENPQLFYSFERYQKSITEVHSVYMQDLNRVQQSINKIKAEPQIKKYINLKKEVANKYKALKEANRSGDASLRKTAKQELTQANANLKTFVRYSNNAHAIKKYQTALKAERELNKVSRELNQTLDAQVYRIEPELNHLESFVGEELARRGDFERVGRPALIDEVTFDGLIREYQQALSSGNQATISEALQKFGPFEQNAELFQALNELRFQKMGIKLNNVDDLYQRYKQYQLDLQKRKNPNIPESSISYMDEAQFQNIIQKLKEARTARDINRRTDLMNHFDGLDQFMSDLDSFYSGKKTKTGNNDLYNYYLEHQSDLVRMYDEYYKAWETGDISTRSALKNAHPDLSTALEQLDRRFQYIDRTESLRFRASALEMTSDLLREFPPGTKATPKQIADYLEKKYNLKESGTPFGVNDKNIELYKVRLSDGNKYRAVLSSTGQSVSLLDGAGNIVQPTIKLKAPPKPVTPKVKPSPQPAVKATKVSAKEKYKTAGANIEQRRKDLISKSDELKLAKERRDQAQKAFMQAEDLGTYDAQAIQRLKQNAENASNRVSILQTEVNQLTSSLRDSIIDRRKAFFARGIEPLGKIPELALKGKDILIDKIRSKWRIDWLNNMKDKMIKVGKVPAEKVAQIFSVLAEQSNISALIQGRFDLFTPYKRFKILLSSIAVNNYSKELQEVVNPLVNEQMVMMHYYTHLRLPSKTEVDNFNNLSIEEKLTAIERGYQSFENGELSPEQLYTLEEQDYISSKRDTLQQALQEAQSLNKLDMDALKAVLTKYLASEENSFKKPYIISVDGITLQVNKEGVISVTGAEIWISKTNESKNTSKTQKDKSTGSVNPQEIGTNSESSISEGQKSPAETSQSTSDSPFFEGTDFYKIPPGTVTFS